MNCKHINNSVVETIENEYARFWIKDDILYNEIKYKIHISEEVMSELIKMRTAISNGQKQYWCLDGKNIKSADKEARDYADVYGQEFLHASAVLVNSHLTKFLFNAFLKLKKPKIPFLVFTEKDEALKWLLKLKAKNKETDF